MSNENWLKRVLIAEKKRRGLPKSSLVFIGMHNLSQFWWCGKYSVLKSKQNELIFFASYIADRVTYALHKGYISKIPKKHLDILKVGDELTFSDIEQLHKKKILTAKKPTSSEQLAQKELIEIQKDLNDTIFDGDKDRFQNKYESGLENESLYAEKYPRFRWNFPYSNYVIVGIPDGITKKFVYEFKSTNSQYLFFFIKPIAFVQGNLYGYFFNKRKKRVQIYIVEKDTLKTFETSVDKDSVKETLEKFESVDKGYKPKLPAKWKCKKCEYKDVCDICQS